MRAVLSAGLISLSIVADALALPSGFFESQVFTGLVEPTVVEFAADGRVFVAEKSGLIKVFANLSAVTPTVFADLRTQVHNFWDRGLLGMKLDPGFSSGRPYVYVLYTFNAPIGGVAPRWPSPDGTNDTCPNPPGATTDGCVVSARLSRLQASGNTIVGPEQVLIEDWCQQYPSHSIGSLTFGLDGALYVSGGEGASFNFVDYGQDGSPINPCGDPPSGVGGVQAPPTAQGGALRSQSLRRAPGAPINLSGAVLRVNPDTGAALPDNPLFGNSNPNARRIVAYGLRNPFRITARPGTSEIWIGDVGWNTWEEINRFRVGPTSPVANFGWPCYEGDSPQGGYEAAGLSLCAGLYATPGAHTSPLFNYNHADPVVAGESCPPGSSSISGLAFYDGGSYPPEYGGALFFADYSRNCIWVILNPPAPITDPPLPPGLVAAYSFNEGSGTQVLDASGKGHTGTIFQATRTASGRYGGALTFDGINDWVTVPDSTLLDLTTGMTLSAWVNPTALSGWRIVIMKEGAGDEMYSLYASTADTNLPAVGIATTGLTAVFGTAQLPLNTWTYLAATYDGTTLRIYVNGILVATTPATGSLRTSTGALRIGGDSIWGEFFQGMIDEVRVYSRPLSQVEIQADMNTPVPAGTAAPTTTIMTFQPSASAPVGLTIGPSGDLFYPDFTGGRIMRIQFLSSNQPPVAVAQGAPLSGPAPLTVSFSGAGSSDPEGGPLTYAWDLDGNGQFNDASSVQPSFTYKTAGTYVVRLRATDNQGATGVSAPLTVMVGGGAPNTPPTGTILTPSSTLTWRVGDTITFSGQATDQQDGALPPSAFAWEVILHHCPSNCHTHPLTNFLGVTGGSFSAPDHEYPSYVEIRLTVTDSGGLTDTKNVLINPATVALTFQSNPTGLQLAVGGGAQAAPFAQTVIIGSTNSLNAQSPQTLGGTTYQFASWSDGGAQSHNITAPASATTYTATFTAGTGTGGLVAAYGFNEASGSTVTDASGNGHTGTILQATRTASGRYGRALTFDGKNDWVTVPDSNLLDLTTGMTLSAWVNPTALSGWRIVIMKEGAGDEMYSLYANTDTNLPAVGITTTGLTAVFGTAQLPLNTWTYLAATYDGTTLRIYVNGILVATTPATGSLRSSTGALRIGGDSIWGEFFIGRIDEVRIYNRALTPAEIQTDMNTPIP